MILVCMCSAGQSQTLNSETTVVSKTVVKPYKIFTTGKQVTIRSETTIKSIMLWTASGHRVLEQNAVNALQYSFNITVNEKIFFVMVQLENGKLYTEKIGVR